jgi:hypothetical protein
MGGGGRVGEENFILGEAYSWKTFLTVKSVMMALQMKGR